MQFSRTNCLETYDAVDAKSRGELKGEKRGRSAGGIGAGQFLSGCRQLQPLQGADCLERGCRDVRRFSIEAFPAKTMHPLCLAMAVSCGHGKAAGRSKCRS